MKVNLESRIKDAIRNNGYELHYTEKQPSSPEDMYEIKFWVEDRNQNQYDFKTIYVHDDKDPKTKAFQMLLNEYMDCYFNKLSEND